MKKTWNINAFMLNECFKYVIDENNLYLTLHYSTEKKTKYTSPMNNLFKNTSWINIHNIKICMWTLFILNHKISTKITETDYLDLFTKKWKVFRRKHNNRSISERQMYETRTTSERPNYGIIQLNFQIRNFHSNKISAGIK